MILASINKELGSIDKFTNPKIWEDIKRSLSSESYNNNSFNNPNSSITSNTFSGSSMDSSHTERPRKVMKTVELKGTIVPNTTSSLSILSFGNLASLATTRSSTRASLASCRNKRSES